MSNLPKLPDELTAEPTTDLSPVDEQKVKAYIEAGMPGLYEVKEDQLQRMMELYLDGKPYTQISRILLIDRTLIMYMAQKFNWYAARREYLHELESTIRQRLVESKVVSQDFLLQLTQMYQKKIGRKVTSYLSTGNEEHANAIDPKEVAQMVKIMEMLHKLGSEAAVGKPVAPAVGLNLGDGVTITKKDDDTVEITPKQKTVGEMLKQFADARRESEKNDKK